MVVGFEGKPKGIIPHTGGNSLYKVLELVAFFELVPLVPWVLKEKAKRNNTTFLVGTSFYKVRTVLAAAPTMRAKTRVIQTDPDV